MPKTDPELKAKLLEKGQWGEFVKYRQELKIGGMSGVEAHHRTLDKFFDHLPEAEREKLKKIHRPGNKTKKKKSTTKGQPVPSSVDGGGSDSPTKLPSPSGSPPSTLSVSHRCTVNEKISDATVKEYTGDLPKLKPVRSEDFDGKQAPEVEVIRWVASNMEIQNPEPKDCPSAAAWGLLAQCRNSPIARGEFWKQTYPKLLPSRAQMEQEQDSVPDESKAKEVIEDLLRFNREAKNAAKEGVEVPKVVEEESPPVATEVEWREGEF